MAVLATVLVASTLVPPKQPGPSVRLATQRPVRSRRRWGPDGRDVEAELLAFIEVAGQPGLMPSRLDLEVHGRGDLVMAIYRKCGGLRALAKRLNLSMAGRRAQRDWSSPEVLRRALLDFAAENCTQGAMPSVRALRAHGRGDLLAAVRRHGGLERSAAMCGLAFAPAKVRPRRAGAPGDPHVHRAGKRAGPSRRRRKPRGYWKDAATVVAEVVAAAESIRAETGAGARVMPTERELLHRRRGDLHRAIAMHGGYFAVAEACGLPRRDRRRRRRWKEEEVLKRALDEFIAANGTAGVMPSHLELEMAGRLDLLNAVYRYHGSLHLVAEKYGLRRKNGGSFFKDWQEFQTVQQELERFKTSEGMDAGDMPSSFQLRRAGRYDLNNAIRMHGGYFNVARRMGLRCVRGGFEAFSNSRSAHLSSRLRRGVELDAVGRKEEEASTTEDRAQIARLLKELRAREQRAAEAPDSRDGGSDE